MKDFHKAAEHFLEQWCDPERKIDGKRPRYSETDLSFVEQFRGNFTCGQLHRFCVCYAVARTVPGKDPTHGKYQTFVDMLKSHRHTLVTRETMPRFVVDRVDEMATHYGKKFLSAVTKALWMVKQHPIVIFDSYAYRALVRLGLSPEGDYSKYVGSWLEFSRRPKESRELSDALARLPESPAARSLEKRSIAETKQVREWAEQPWFRDRVVDMYLWFAGK